MLPGHRLRRPTPADVDGVVALIREAEALDDGEAERTPEDLAIAWRTIDTERNVWLVEDDAGRLVASAAVRPRLPVRIGAFAAVAPGERGRGIGTALLALIEARARELLEEARPEGRVPLGQGVGQHNDGARRLLEANGYSFARRFWRMGIELDAPRPEPQWADGIRLETLREAREREVHEAMEEAFEDHWGFAPHEYDEWRAWNVERESFDPSLWFIAWDGDEIAAVSQCGVEGGVAWVSVLGVRRPWRRRGLGLALLQHSFAEFRRRGEATAVLEVDSENPTGATRLYERAGMSVVRCSDFYEKVLQEGLDA